MGKKGVENSRGLAYTLAICIVPIIIYGFQKWSGLWEGKAPAHYSNSSTFITSNTTIIEIGTILAGFIALLFIRSSFLLFPICLAFISLTSNSIGFLVTKEPFDWDIQRWVFLVLGSIMTCAAYFFDRKTKEDYSFWLYLFGLSIFSYGITLLWDFQGEFGKALFGTLSFASILLSIRQKRLLLLSFGGMGVFIYITYLAYSVFADSMFFLSY